MIIVSNWQDADYDLMDEVWFITNNNPKMPQAAKHHPELAPDPVTYKKYRESVISIDILLRTYKEDLEAGVYAEEIRNLVEYQKDKFIQLVCYCKGKCHRYVLAEYLAKYHQVEVRIQSKEHYYV